MILAAEVFVARVVVAGAHPPAPYLRIPGHRQLPQDTPLIQAQIAAGVLARTDDVGHLPFQDVLLSSFRRPVGSASGKSAPPAEPSGSDDSKGRGRSGSPGCSPRSRCPERAGRRSGPWPLPHSSGRSRHGRIGRPGSRDDEPAGVSPERVWPAKGQSQARQTRAKPSQGVWRENSGVVISRKGTWDHPGRTRSPSAEAGGKNWLGESTCPSWRPWRRRWSSLEPTEPGSCCWLQRRRDPKDPTPRIS